MVSTNSVGYKVHAVLFYKCLCFVDMPHSGIHMLCLPQPWRINATTLLVLC